MYLRLYVRHIYYDYKGQKARFVEPLPDSKVGHENEGTIKDTTSIVTYLGPKTY